MEIEGDMKQLFGLSLSLCVSDILRGLVNESDVDGIVAGTMAKNDKDFTKVTETYQEYYWDDHGEGSEIAWRLWRDGKIYQPRCDGHDPHNIAYGHWVEIATQ